MIIKAKSRVSSLFVGGLGFGKVPFVFAETLENLCPFSPYIFEFVWFFAFQKEDTLGESFSEEPVLLVFLFERFVFLFQV